MKNFIWSFVEVGHNLFSASDIFDGLQFANVIKNLKMGVAKTNKYLSVLNRKTISDIGQYHSVQFHENHMRFWRNFNVGVQLLFHTQILHFYLVLKGLGNLRGQVTAKLLLQKHYWAWKKIEYWSLCTLMFCSEPVCSSTFDIEQFEKHVAEKQ